MGITITPVDPADQGAVDAAYRIRAAADAADVPDFPPPCRRRLEAALRHPMPGCVPVWALAHRDGVPAGYLGLELPQLDNTDNATVELFVDPAHRRHGVGRALHEHCLRVLRGQGRKRVVGMAVSALPDGPGRDGAGGAFAAAVGARPALAEVRRRLDAARVDPAALDTLLADARPHAAGYRTVGWQGHAPEEYVAEVAHLDGRLMADAPIGDLEWEPERIDVKRVRGIERALDARGRRRYHHGAVHVASGRLVAWTVLDVGPDLSWHAFQQITIVDPAHRGHRLGLLTKVENLRYALGHEPALRAVDTFNAAANGHMIAINERLGFRPVDAWTDWQLTL
ncbi:GNAT family N-acetyltransferase [Micromonospora sp. NBC_01655]|uniref:GNAT family N-acetyltransferase n=1 Tax=Micromonospora sp. NBC_01655 TaxID=2975983 RepID=UPI00225831E0|nr:GNAT family N-acetyltransferase [Micromonospora sp. NBC_01655]MCX4469750.1 GNAT family N-acetyltransferase [Micromonospora sp. NBC_01655]